MRSYPDILEDTIKETSNWIREVTRFRLNDITEFLDLRRYAKGDFYEDLRFGATAVNPQGGASDPDFDTTNGGFLFGAGSTELIFVSAQLPHSWKEATPIYPHVHWQKTTSAAGDVYWRLEYKWSPIGEVMDAAFTTVNATTVISGVTDNDTADEHLKTSFGEISTTGKQISDMLVMKLSRIGGDAADTYGADARLLEFDIHYKNNTRGSFGLYTKRSA